MSVSKQFSICAVSVSKQFSVCAVSVSKEFNVCAVSLSVQFSVCAVSVSVQFSVCALSVSKQLSVCAVSVSKQFSVCAVSVSKQFSVCAVSVSEQSSVWLCQYQNTVPSQYQNSSLSVPFQYQNSSASVPCQYQNSSVSVPCQYQNSPVFNWLLNQVVTYYRYNIVVKLIVKSGGNLLSLQHCSNHFVDWLTDWLIQSLRRSSRNRVTYLSFRLFVFNPSPTHFFTGVFASFLLVLWSWYFELYFNTMSILGGVRLFLVSRLSSQTHCDRQGLVTAPLISQSDQPCAVITWTSASLTTWRP